MEVVVNGAPRVLDPGTSLADMLEQMGLDRRFLVVPGVILVPIVVRFVFERMLYISLPRSEIEGVTLADGDRLELVRPVAGG